ncbi:MAG TPA: hypothetical protein EYG80_06050 [Flavobacteriaceae bacterium]|nr:hypothetical protein [Flavobacteriaceae bacterium]
MGSYTYLTVDSYPILSSKSYVSDDISCIFCESDKKVFNRSIKDRNSMVWGHISSEDIEIAYEYQTTVKTAIERLEIMGYSLIKTKLDFIVSKNKLLEEYNEYIVAFSEDTISSHIWKNKREFLKPLNFNDFTEAFIEVRIKKY